MYIILYIICTLKIYIINSCGYRDWKYLRSTLSKLETQDSQYYSSNLNLLPQNQESWHCKL
jgi:hypothetical protein